MVDDVGQWTARSLEGIRADNRTYKQCKSDGAKGVQIEGEINRKSAFREGRSFIR